MPSDRMAARVGDTRGIAGAISRVWATSYAPDYIGLALLFLADMAIVAFIEPFHRLFSVSDLAIAYPHAETERVSVPMNVVYALVLPLVLQVLVLLVTRSPFHKHRSTYLPFFIALVVAALIKDVVKNAAGRPRPDLLARCLPAPETPPDVLVGIEVCTRSADAQHHLLHDGWRSFPSGHASFSFAGLGFTSLWLGGQLRLFRAEYRDSNGILVFSRQGGDLGRAIVCAIPVLGALLIAMSRLEDYRHDVWDVCAGALIGSTVAYWSYRRYWPSLRAKGCDEPFPPVGHGPEKHYGWSRVRDLEEGGS